MKKKNVKRIITLLLCCFMIVGVAACGGSDSGTGSTSGSGGNEGGGSSDAGSGGGGEAAASTRDSITIALAADAGTLSPAHASGDSMRICLLIQDPLFDYLDDGTIIWLLAESIDVHGDDHWTVHLRQGVTFNNGNPFTASDVVFSIQLTRDSGIGTPRTNNADLTRTYAADDHTVELYWDAYHDAQWQGLSDVMIYDEESYDVERSSTNPIGTGPYVVTEYLVNSHVNLERRDDYWGEPPQLKNISFRFMAETSQVVNALETGRIDIGPVAAQDYDYVSGLDGYYVDRIYQANYLTVGFAMNESSVFYNNKEARYAVAHALNKQSILDIVYYGYGRTMKGPNTEQSINHIPYFDNLHPTYSTGYDLDLARQYAESSGLAGKEITIITTSTPALLAASEMIQNMLADINVTARVDSYDSASIRQLNFDLNSTHDMTVNLGINPAMVYQGPIINGILYNPVYTTAGWDTREEYLERAMDGWTISDPARREEAVKWIVDVYVDECLFYGLVDIQFCYAYRDDIVVPPPFRAQMNFRYQEMKFG